MKLTDTFHFIHLDPNEAPLTAETQVFMQSFRDWHPAAQTMVWTYAKIRDEGHAVPAQFYAETDLRSQANVLRYWILATIGGIYCDTDVICLRNWDEWTGDKEAFVCQFEEMRVGVTNCIMGALPGNTFFPNLVALLPGLGLVYQHAPFMARTGSQILFQLLASKKYDASSEHPLIVAEPAVFCPYKMSQANAGEVPNLDELTASGSLSVHLWASTDGARGDKYLSVAQRMMNALGYPNLVAGTPLETLSPRVVAGGNA